MRPVLKRPPRIAVTAMGRGALPPASVGGFLKKKRERHTTVSFGVFVSAVKSVLRTVETRTCSRHDSGVCSAFLISQLTLFSLFSSGKTLMFILGLRIFCRSVWAASRQNITGIAKHWLDKLLQLVVGWINVFFRSNITLTTLPRLMGVCNIYFLPLMSPSAD